jgi:multicomponent Na+:H+ antiporter subunit D
MSWLPPLLVAVPLMAAALIAAGDVILPRSAENAIGVLAAGGTCALSLVLVLESQKGSTVHWFGGWEPRHGLAIGIDFVADPFAAGMCALAGGIVFLALLYSWTFLEDAAHLYVVLLLVCCGALCGFALSGDLFNLFVWLELAGVAAFALTGFEIRQIGPLQGAVNFAIVNTLGGYFVLLGIALVYARTGALNLAQIGRSLGGREPDGLVIVAMTLVFVGFLCKAAIVPFHFWLADAYAVAPAPVCAIFAAVMTDIGLVGVARIYWTAFSPPFAGHAHAVGDLLLWLGIVTALLGGTMAFLQRHLKRMLAYSVVCHIGIMLAGIGLLSSKGLAGAAAMLLAHAFLTGGLFLAVGVLLAWLRSVDELELHGRARERRLLGLLWAAGAFGLAGMPYVGVYLGHSLIDDAAVASGRRWAALLLWLAGATASAALLRAGARVFLGWGPAADPLLTVESRERPPPRGARTTILGSLTALMLVLGLCVSVVPGLAQRTEYGAERFRDRAAYAALVLDGKAAPEPHARLPFAVASTSLESVAYGFGSTVLAILLAALGLERRRLPQSFRKAGTRVLGPPIGLLKTAHSGVIGDYVTWLTVGTALIGGIWAVILR